ncbi:roadblock/LC7 domain-containing protein [Amycolatopsis sp. Hca4]|uniref:roadblock/LC7 domain-containing protein n=1 Tax=Amycolatopsis sp. Hca4 TaxID=2742131 RepID=UPI0015914FB7|nr:roadblock/LC7 domain-containing protein [Amycolatopsis sp. Hca4]QKV73830.1 roadblock/LC7 domain-containing protein [Amycolatopsis sp. Hca4]
MVNNGRTPVQRANSWLVDELVVRAPGAAHAIAASADGLVLAASAWLPLDRADQLAAIAAAVMNLASGAARCLEAGDAGDVVVEMDLGYVVVMALGHGATLAVLASSDSDLGRVGYEMAKLVEQVKQAMTPELRAQLEGIPTFPE